MRKILLGLLVALLFVVPIFAGGVHPEMRFDFGGRESVPEPRLLSPISEVVDLTGKDTLEFKWSPFEGRLFKRKYYDFRIYKGREMYFKDEIFKQKVPRGTYSVVLKADIFEDGQVYTWAVRQVYDDDKSDQAYSAFRVVKRQKSK